MLDGSLPYINDSELIVQKFGGSILNAGEGIEDLRRVTEYDGKQVIVLSALKGVTDRLKKYDETRKLKLLEGVLSLYSKVGRKWIKTNTYRKEFEKTLKKYRNILIRSDNKDEILSSGEDLVSELFYFAEISRGEDVGIIRCGPNFPIICSDTPGNADPLLEKIDTRILNEELDKHSEIIFPGFEGMTENEKLRTLGRGGTDTTAVVLGYASKAPVILWKETKGIRTADPKIVKKTKHIPSLTYSEARNITKFGGKVVQHKAIKIAEKTATKPVTSCIGNPKIYTIIGGDGTWKSPVKYVGGTDSGVVIDGCSFEEIIQLRHLCDENNYQEYFHASLNFDRGKVILLSGEFLGAGYKNRERVGIVGIVGKEMEKASGILDRAAAELKKQRVNVRGIGSGVKGDSYLYLLVDPKEFAKTARIEHKEFIENQKRRK